MRDFEFDENALEKQNKDLEDLAVQEKELWVSCCDIRSVDRRGYAEGPPVLPYAQAVLATTFCVRRGCYFRSSGTSMIPCQIH